MTSYYQTSHQRDFETSHHYFEYKKCHFVILSAHATSHQKEFKMSLRDTRNTKRHITSTMKCQRCVQLLSLDPHPILDRVVNMNTLVNRHSFTSRRPFSPHTPFIPKPTPLRFRPDWTPHSEKQKFDYLLDAGPNLEPMDYTDFDNFPLNRILMGLFRNSLCNVTGGIDSKTPG